MGGILLILLGALLIKAITGMKYRKSFFIIELPEYKVPSLGFAVKSMLERGKAYIIKAGTIATVYAISNLIDTEELELIGEGNAVAAVMGITKVAALAYLMFNLYTPPHLPALQHSVP